jgi:hypothetical protein
VSQRKSLRSLLEDLGITPLGLVGLSLLGLVLLAVAVCAGFSASNYYFRDAPIVIRILVFIPGALLGLVPAMMLLFLVALVLAGLGQVLSNLRLGWGVLWRTAVLAILLFVLLYGAMFATHRLALVLFALFGPVTAFALYRLRRANLFVYGCIEVGFGLTTILARSVNEMLKHPKSTQLPTLSPVEVLSMIGGVYIIIRGLDSIGRSVFVRDHLRWWIALFPSTESAHVAETSIQNG